MKKIIYILIILLTIGLLSICYVTSCAPTRQHADPFYNYNDSNFPRDYLPIINPVKAVRDRPNYPWAMKLLNHLSIDLPKSNEQEVQEIYIYSHVSELEKFAVKDDVILAYSSHADQRADAYIQENFYHWYVMIPSEDITEGFQTEDEFNQYIETIGIQNPDWQTPDDAFHTFLETGCLDWFPDC